MKCRCFPLSALFILLLAFTSADEEDSHALVKRQIRPGVPLSRSRQFPAPEELEESDEYVSSEEEEPQVPRFRGRQPQPIDDEYENTYTEAPKTTTPAPPKPTSRTAVFNSRLAARPRFGQQPSTSSSTSKAPEPAARTPAQSQRLDVVASILNQPPPQRPSARSISSPKPINEITKKPTQDTEPASRRVAVAPQRTRTRGRQRAKSTTTTTTTTTTEPPQTEEYYYYYEDEADDVTIATTTSTTTTTTTRRPFTKRPAGNSRSRSSSKPVVRFDPDFVQFVPPPDNPLNVVKPSSSTTKRYTTSTTLSPEDGGAIPPHLRSRYRARSDGRFIDFLRDPNRPRELKGFDLTDYPFYVTVPEDIVFDCDDKKDGYYASIPHRCQLFHYCFAGARYDFLCANYTLYDQTTFTCRFANNVDCESSEKFYNRNDDLWKETPTTTTTLAPETRRRRKPKPRDYEYDEDDYDYDEEEERRRNRRRRNRMKNKKKQPESEEEEK